MNMDDIAQLAKVSKASVSLALNDQPGVSDETRQRVLQIAKAHNYRPRRRTTKPVAKPILHFITVNIKGQKQRPSELPFFANLIAEISVITQRQHISLQIEALDESQLTNWAKSVSEDDPLFFGTIVLATSLTREQILMFTRSLSKVLILDSDYKDLAVNAVAIDNYLGGFRAASALLQRGYRDIGYVEAVEQYPNYTERRKGFLDKLTDAGIAPTQTYSVNSMSMQQCTEDEEIFTHPLPRAIFCDNDYIAIRLMRLALQKGIRIPQELGVIGFDDITEGHIVSPELTTIHVPVHTIAKVAVSRLTELASGKLNEYTFKQLIEPQLIQRHSL
ncbi:LacI family DNA-binding transcriptional regulator [Lacticaseibacillus sp. N501-2]|uniref:LacI family DNA-binding transcriptional regulator n=1 Tax=Lacticaseibacillus salsurae TaxID=3367729 RepID=UPI0038B29FB7